MQLFYNPHINDNTTKIIFDKAESRHIIKVLRKSIGDKLFITNGQGLLVTSKISTANDKKCIAQSVHKEKKERQRNYRLHVGVAPTKSIDRFEWFLEKATEIGVDEITPLLCEHSERKVIKNERLQKIVESAMKQSLKYYLPTLNPIISFKDFINNSLDGELYIAHCENTYKYHLKNKLESGINVSFLIGPEGDFSHSEIALAIKNNFVPISLGKSRLRTETAALVAVNLVQCINQ